LPELYLRVSDTQLVALNLLIGDKVSVSNVMGKGFPVENIPADKISTILIFATGSGIRCVS
jgi:ferredoxin-NADP reductase